jgi:hypothetical protein
VRKAAIKLILSAAKEMQVSSVEELVSHHTEEFKSVQPHVIQSLEAQWGDAKITGSRVPKRRSKTTTESESKNIKSPILKSPPQSPSSSKKTESEMTESPARPSPVKESRKSVRRSLAEELAGFSWEK